MPGGGGLLLSCTVIVTSRLTLAAPSDTVTVTADVTKPVEVTAKNTYPVGSGEVVKVTAGKKYTSPSSPWLEGWTAIAYRGENR